MGPEESEVKLRFVRRGGRIFEIFSTKEKSEHSVANKVRWHERQRHKWRRKKEEEGTWENAEDEGDLCWTEVCHGIAKTMLQYLDSEVTEVSTRELNEQFLSPNKSKRLIFCALRGKQEMRNVKSCFRSSDKERTRSSSLVRRGGMNN